MDNIFLAELVGTAILILLGDGVVAGVLLAKSKAENSGWIVITAGWAFAVMAGAYSVFQFTGAHLNPAVTLGIIASGGSGIDFGEAMQYFGGQLVGAMIGALLVYIHYLPHWKETSDPGLKLAVFSTGPAIRNTATNLISEIIGTFTLVFGILVIADHLGGVDAMFQNSLLPLLVAFLVFGIGLSLGGPTGYAINPARDLGPRIMHALLPIPGKGGSDWSYAWIPVIGPLVGGFIGGLLFKGLYK